MRYNFQFNFSDRDEGNTKKLNSFLGAIELSSCKLEAVDCYSYISTHFDYSSGEKQVDSVNYGLGFNSGVLVCEDEDEDKAIFQIETAAFPIKESVHTNQFVEAWRESHPDKIIRTVTEWEFDTCTGFAVIYQNK